MVHVQGYAGGSFESNVVIDLVEVASGGASGRVLARQAMTYRAPDVGMPGPWDAALDVPAEAARARLRVVAHFESPRDGSRVAEATLDLP